MNYIVWLTIASVFAILLGWLSTKNLTEMKKNGRPRLKYKQVVFDAVAFVMTLVCFVLLILADFRLVAESIAPFFNLKTEAPYVFSFLIIAAIHAVYFRGLHYLSAGIQQVTLVNALDDHEQKVELRLRKEYRDGFETEIDSLLAAWETDREEIILDKDFNIQDVASFSNVKAGKKVLTSEDINAGADEVDKIVDFRTTRAR
ncbi:hypothetical protein IJG91_01590 [Candidatus Saccharibacteria bacterium]|nr:hypothetical protein [Candidatus Saccharibacteria bacterium]